ncbi:MAG: FtsK/SpoIIIE domain-containing protein [Candidatus Dormibacteria bacterium]
MARFGELPHSRQSVADSIESAAGSLGDVRAELDRRLEALRRAGYRDIDEWMDAEMPEWPRVVVVVDEVAELTVRDLGGDKVGRAAQQAAVGRLCEIARLGRAAGIHLIVCTQRPDAEAVPGQLKANLAGTVAFRVRSGVNSLILLESDRAAMLPPHPGRAVWAHDREEEFQAIFLSGEDSRKLLEERWGAKLIHGTTAPVTPWCQTPEAAELSLPADDEDAVG